MVKSVGGFLLNGIGIHLLQNGYGASPEATLRSTRGRVFRITSVTLPPAKPGLTFKSQFISNIKNIFRKCCSPEYSWGRSNAWPLRGHD
jgi:hypothetical protein